MRVIQVIAGIAEEAKGPSYSVPKLCQSLGARGPEVELHVIESEGGQQWQEVDIHGHSGWTIAPRLGISPDMKRALQQAARSAEILHNHGLWMMPNIYSATAVRGTNCRLVMSPRGSLSDWALKRSRWRKRVMWWLCQRSSFRRAACFHATCDGEHRDIRKAGMLGPVTIIPNGVDIPSETPRVESSGARKRLLFLGRFHPGKGIDFLLNSWRAVQRQSPDWELHLVGPDIDGHSAAMEQMAKSIGVERVYFRGPMYGQAKRETYQSSDLFVLPTHSENFGMVVAEALAHGVPTIVTRGAPWSGLQEHDCGWWIDIGVGPLTDCLRSVLQLSREELQTRGRRGRDWMQRDFSWARVAKMMHETYLWLLGGGAAPPWVMVHG